MDLLRKTVVCGVFMSLTFISAGCQKGDDSGVETGPKNVKKAEALTAGMVAIPAGEFIMGSEDKDTEMLQQRFGMRKIPYQNEHPIRKVRLGKYFIDDYEVTAGQYQEFVTATKHPAPAYWENGVLPKGLEETPVMVVSWYDADAYCRWKGKRLPNEEEWEKAARGPNGNRFPWGNTFDDKKANMLGLRGTPTPVKEYVSDVSAYGVHGMAGNASEWVQNWYQPYPGNEFLDEAYGESFKVLRGGSWGGIGHYSFEFFYRSTFRNYEKPESTMNDVGFRCAFSET
ncbi:MAG: formylglycine-generating enzyme family protein [Nitrospinota bacterium]